MSNETFNFYYDPTRQGYDANTWSTLIGTPIVVANHLQLDNSSIIHYADLLRGDLTFSLNLQTPVPGSAVEIGFVSMNKMAFIMFSIVDEVLTAIVSDGTTLKSEVITWDTDWSNTDIKFRIKWESGIATFYIDDQFKVAFSDTYLLGVPNIMVPDSPMSIGLETGAGTILLLNYFEVLGIQSSDLHV